MKVNFEVDATKKDVLIVVVLSVIIFCFVFMEKLVVVGDLFMNGG